MFIEFQEGDLCRKHAVNAYFGKPLLSTNDFYKYCNIYDNKFNEPENTSKKWLYGDSGWNLISFIIYSIRKEYYKLYRFNTFPTYNLNNIYNCFAFNTSHIYFIKKINNQWYKLDSLNKNPQKVSKPSINKKLGYFFKEIKPDHVKTHFFNFSNNQN